MANLVAHPPGELRSGRYGLVGATARARLRIVPQREIVSMIARRNGLDALYESVRQKFGVGLPDKPQLVHGSPASFLWCGDQQWFAMAAEGADLMSALRQQVNASTSLSDQSDSRLIVELSGSVARAILAKLAPIDFHPREFPVGATALTVLDHVGVQITHIGDEPTYELMVFRSFADSVLHSILAAGAEFGIDVIA